MPDPHPNKHTGEARVLYDALFNVYEALRQELPHYRWAIESQHERLCDLIDDAMEDANAIVADRTHYDEVTAPPALTPRG